MILYVTCIFEKFYYKVQDTFIVKLTYTTGTCTYTISDDL